MVRRKAEALSRLDALKRLLNPPVKPPGRLRCFWRRWRWLALGLLLAPNASAQTPTMRVTSLYPPLSTQEAADVLRPYQFHAGPCALASDCDGPRVAIAGRFSLGPWDREALMGRYDPRRVRQQFMQPRYPGEMPQVWFDDVLYADPFVARRHVPALLLYPLGPVVR